MMAHRITYDYRLATPGLEEVMLAEMLGGSEVLSNLREP